MHGFALVEVLVATFVLALALTGMLQLQLVALRTQQQNIYNGNAARLATDMAEMIYAYGGTAHGGATAFMLDYRSERPPPPAPACHGSTRCGPDQLRASEVALWLQSLHEELPHGRARICRDAAPYDTTEKNYTWRCQSGGYDSNNGGHGENGSHHSAGIVIKLGWRVPGGFGATTASPADAPLLVLGIGDPSP